MAFLESCDGRLERLVVSAAPAVVASGFDFVEGPVWDPVRNWLTFSDIPANKMLRWDPRDGVRTVRDPNNMGNGMTDDLDGSLLVCEHATSRVVRVEHDGSSVVLAEHYRGRELNSPNDVIVTSTGVIMFTDPIYGRRSYVGKPREPELDFAGVYAFSRAEDSFPVAPRLLTAEIGSPNGLCLSPDERYLFIADTETFEIRRYRFDGSGLTGGRVWARTEGPESDGPDGIRVDEYGTVYCAGPGGIHAFNPNGEPLGLIRMPEVVANLTWGGPRGRTMYVCATSSVYAIEMSVRSGRHPRK